MGEGEGHHRALVCLRNLLHPLADFPLALTSMSVRVQGHEEGPAGPHVPHPHCLVLAAGEQEVLDAWRPVSGCHGALVALQAVSGCPGAQVTQDHLACNDDMLYYSHLT